MTMTLSNARKRWDRDVLDASTLRTAADEARNIAEEMFERITDANENWLDSEIGQAFQEAYDQIEEHATALDMAADYSVEGP